MVGDEALARRLLHCRRAFGVVKGAGAAGEVVATRHRSPDSPRGNEQATASTAGAVEVSRKYPMDCQTCKEYLEGLEHQKRSAQAPAKAGIPALATRPVSMSVGRSHPNERDIVVVDSLATVAGRHSNWVGGMAMTEPGFGR